MNKYIEQLQRRAYALEWRIVLLENADKISYIKDHLPEGWKCEFERDDWEGAKVGCSVDTPEGHIYTTDLRLVEKLVNQENAQLSIKKQKGGKE